MNFPLWDVPFAGGGLIVAAVAILHVFFAQFAVGGGLWLVLTEQRAYREEEPDVLDFVRSRSRFFLVLTLVLGAATGVGVWLTITAVSPEATTTLLRVFLWAWAIEWTVFLVEVVAAIVYYYGWDRLDRRTHLVVGWIYAIAAWVSLAIVNGILTFMLTPGGWRSPGGDLADALFNPSYFPSLLLRTLSCVALAGLYALVAATKIPEEDLRARMVAYSAKWLMPPFFLMPVAGLWFFQRIDPAAAAIATGGAPPVMIFLALSVLFSLFIFGFSWFYAVRRPLQVGPGLALLLVLLGFMVTATSEWVREAVRKPFILRDRLYANSIEPGAVEDLGHEGILSAARWVRPIASDRERGREVFLLECSACHTARGYNGIEYLTRGWDEDFLYGQIGHLDTLKGYMPPFAGTDDERRALARWLDSLDGEEP